MSRTYRGAQRRDGKHPYKAPSIWKRLSRAKVRAKDRQALREGREPAAHKNHVNFDWN